jgi:hypothetical protein
MTLVVLALKVLLAPSLVAAATRTARALGHRAGGLVGGLPVVAAPIVFIYAVEHGASFAARAAQGTVLGIVSLVGFSVAYAEVGRRTSWPLALLAGWSAFLVLTLLFATRSLPLALSCVLAAVAVAGASRVLARRVSGPASSGGSDLLRWRLLATAAMVVALTTAAGSLSPWVSGLLAPFPIITAVLAAFTQAQAGADASTELLAGLVPGLASFILFFVVVGVGLPALGIPGAFALATAAALASHVVLAGRARRAQRAGARLSGVPQRTQMSENGVGA